MTTKSKKSRRDDGLTTRERASKKVARARARRKKIRAVAFGTLYSFASLIAVFAVCYHFWLKDSPAFQKVETRISMKIDKAQLAMGLELKDIVLVGRKKASLDDVKEALGINVGDPLFSLSLGESRERLEKVNWVKSAHLTRKFPGTLVVDIVERKPIALWQSKGQLKLIDGEGVVIVGENLGEYSDLPIVIGENAPAKVYELFKMLSLEEKLFEQVSSVTLIGDRRWDVKFYNGVEIKLPEETPEAAWHYLAELQDDKKILEKDITSLDFRLKDRVFIGLPQNRQDVLTPKKAGEPT